MIAIIFSMALLILIMILVPTFHYIFCDDDNDDTLILFHMISTVFIIIWVILVSVYMNRPTAMDVYQGKTTLEITYKDGVPVDSVVVWKGGEK